MKTVGVIEKPCFDVKRWRFVGPDYFYRKSPIPKVASIVEVGGNVEWDFSWDSLSNQILVRGITKESILV